MGTIDQKLQIVIVPMTANRQDDRGIRNG